MSRVEFTKATKLAAKERADGHCERCGALLVVGKFAFDHVNPAAFTNDNSLENIQCICSACHHEKTCTQDIPAIAKSNRVRYRAAGIKPDRTIRAWRRFDGSPVYKSRER